MDNEGGLVDRKIAPFRRIIAMSDEPSFTDAELKAEFAALFPQGWAGPDVLAEIAPEGWEKSPLAAVFHPSVEKAYEEQLRLHRNLANFPGRKPDAEMPPEPTFEEIQAEHDTGPIEPARECQELVGRCLWDVFSDNHDVLAEDGQALELGSQRASGGFLAEVLNSQGGPPPPPRPEMPAELEEKLFPKSDDSKVQAMIAEMRREMFGDGGYSYLDFYMGTSMVSDRADLTPVYEMIFRRLKARGLDWKYSFPRLHLVDMRHLKRRLDEEKRLEAGQAEFEDYDPEASLAEEKADREHDAELAEMREKLDEGHREAVAAARDAEPPTTVRAYRRVYGDFPNGWPPEVE
jgi:hypothetical protein